MDVHINETVSGSVPHQEGMDLSLLTGNNDDIFQPSSKKPPYSVESLYQLSCCLVNEEEAK